MHRAPRQSVAKSRALELDAECPAEPASERQRVRGMRRKECDLAWADASCVVTNGVKPPALEKRNQDRPRVNVMR